MIDLSYKIRDHYLIFIILILEEILVKEYIVYDS